MKELEKIIQIGRKMGGTRGGEIQLEGHDAFLTNTKRSSIYLINSSENLGTGTFYSSQALLTAEKVERRDDKVWFHWRENGVNRREFVPNLQSFRKELMETIKKKATKQYIKIPPTLFTILYEDLLITKLKVKNNNIIATQIRSDGSVGFENEISLSRGLIRLDYDDTDEISIFTSDLLLLKPFVEDHLEISFSKNNPLTVYIPYSNGKLLSLIGNLEYD